MVGCNSSENVAGTEWDLQVIVVLKVGFGPGHVAKRPILEKQWGLGQVIKKTLVGGRAGNSGHIRADVVLKMGLVPGHVLERLIGRSSGDLGRSLKGFFRG